jgi:phenylalanyl-tRNA synthetase beta chain
VQAGGRFEVRYPAFRTDVRHPVDLFEDLAIGYGYSNIEPSLVPTLTVGQARPEEDLSSSARSALVGLGFSEIMSLPLATEEEHFLRFRLPVPEAYARVANPKMKALTVVRSHLLTGLLQALYTNRRRPMPLRLFELDDAVVLDDSAQTGARGERRLAFVEMGREAGYASVRSVLDALLRELGLRATFEPDDHPSFLEGRCARVRTPDGPFGFLGELHPEVITAFRIDHPVAVADLCLVRVS